MPQIKRAEQQSWEEIRAVVQALDQVFQKLGADLCRNVDKMSLSFLAIDTGLTEKGEERER